MKTLCRSSLLSIVLFAIPLLAQPLVFRGGVVNAASATPNLMPGGAIAQGSIFSIYGSGIGPAAFQTANQFPLGNTLAGVSITLKQGTTQVSAIPDYVQANQINAILPSNTPTGTVSLQVTYNSVASNWVSFQVAAHAPGIFTAAGTGRGWGILQNFVDGALPLNTSTSAAKPGQIVILWLTGTGAITAPDNVAPPYGSLPYNISIIVGGKTATNVSYTGRAPGFAGLEQFVFAIPSDAPTGCFVPISVNVEGAVSNAITAAISTDGGACSDSQNPISAALVKGGKIIDAMLYRGTTSAGQVAGVNVDVSADKASVRAMEEPGGLFPYDPFLSLPPEGSCTSYSLKGNLLVTGAQAASAGRPLSLGTISMQAGTTQNLSTKTPGVYDSLLGGGYPTVLAAFFGQGATTLKTSGGTDSGALSVPIASSPQLTGFNTSQLTAIDRSAGLNVTWTPQSGVSALITGGVFDKVANGSALFTCISPKGAGSMTVPPYILSALPATRTNPGLVDALLFLSAMPAITEASGTGQVRVFTSREDVIVRSVSTVK